MLKIDFAFDLGTDFIRLYKEGKKIEEFPAFDKQINELLVNGGKVCRFYELEQQMRTIVKKHMKLLLGFIWIGKRNGLMIIPAEYNSVNMRAFRDLMEFMGFTSTYMIYDYLVAATGLGIRKENTYMIVDSGAGKTRITTFCKSEEPEVNSSVTEMAGNSLNEMISFGLSHEFNIRVSWETVEALKREFGTLVPESAVRNILIKGEDKITGQATEVTITSKVLNNWLQQEAERIKGKIRQHYELVSPEVQTQIQKTGIHLVGKNFYLPGFVDLIAQELPVSPLSYQFSRDYMEEGLCHIQQNPVEYLTDMLE